jgi:SAM-dependent methyltransferase
MYTRGARLSAMDAKTEVRDFWEREACGERYAAGADVAERLQAQARKKYELEPYIPGFARFEDGRGKAVLEIGVGMGVDHGEWARHAPAYLAGVDLTDKAVQLTKERLALAGLTSDLRVGDAENLPFTDDSFDIVYSWGVLHHTPDPAAAVREVHRVLRSGGRARIMLYRKYGLVFLLLWGRYAILAGQWGRSVEDVVAVQNESPGTRVYARDGVEQLFTGFSSVDIRPLLSHGDLLEGDVGARHRGVALTLAKTLWPRQLVRRLPPWFGSCWVIDAIK